MKIKRFFAKDIRQALRQVRETLGPDAVILSNRQVDGGVELVAAMDYQEAAFASVGRAEPPQERASAPARPEEAAPEAGEAVPERPRARVEWSQDPVLVEMRREMQSLRRMMENQLSGLSWRDLGDSRPTTQELYRRLMAIGLSPDICKGLIGRVEQTGEPEQAWRQALGLLAADLPTTGEKLLEEGGIVALIGPTGVGKTEIA
ncbi:MAG: flagellar biosynthesis protein FlhF, partial [Candidatus Sedimenticola endophacoides]